MFETAEVGDRMEELFKKTRHENEALDDQIESLNMKIEDVDAEIVFKGHEV